MFLPLLFIPGFRPMIIDDYADIRRRLNIATPPTEPGLCPKCGMLWRGLERCDWCPPKRGGVVLPADTPASLWGRSRKEARPRR